MPSVAERSRNNVRAGVFVSITLILVLAIIVSLTGAWRSLLQRTRDYVVTFDVASGVKNLQSGSDVRVGGVSMGEVKRIEPRLGDSRAFETIEVLFSIDERIALFADAKIYVATPMIGSDAWLNIPDVGNPTSGPPPNSQIAGAETVGLLTTMLGPANAETALNVFERTEKFSQFLERLPNEYDRRVSPMLADAGEAVAGIRSMVVDVRDGHWLHWVEAVNEVVTWSADATVRLDAVLAEGQGLMQDTRGVICDNRPQLDAIVGNAELTSRNVLAASERINGEVLDKFDALLDSGQKSLDGATAAMETIQRDYDGWAVDIADTLANLSLTGQQLKLTSIEVRRSPWKLLYRPEADELEHELLYEATRAFALAASDLKAASASAQRVLERHGEELASDREVFQRLQDRLLDSLDRYEKAQQDLFDVILVSTPPPGER